ncbi:3-dehydroquinate synthase [Immundisolibacter sp.]|uniref:3-dehydroquinate synthase n=1 Tax=Immundisolibacter sp. TaxID=1934948 RepID=UPI0026375889|nr:3-dehydroquinate synthase [Immundisolibacter sp.]MDD3650431.1 3-dehydroquinate synthase [Immundisolibacter sp.]
MRTLRLDLADRSYGIHIGPGLLDQADLYRPHIRGRRVVVISDRQVAGLYGERVCAALADYQPLLLQFEPGEASKTLETYAVLADALIEGRFDRRVTLVALGGGVVGDMTGFLAATYQRGVDFIQVPTTLLAQVDSSVGGKTGINRPGGKNLLGAFHQPRCVLADTATLATLPRRELVAGLAEVIKYGLIADAEFLAWIERELPALLAGDDEALQRAIYRSCEIKAQIVAADERESGQRALLNLGHTFGHAIEAATGYGAWLHGEAVGLGMLMAAGLSARLGRLPANDVARVAALLERAGLPTRLPADIATDTLLGFMAGDKKVLDGQLRLVALDAIGRGVIVSGVPLQVLAEVIDATRAGAA